MLRTARSKASSAGTALSRPYGPRAGVARQRRFAAAADHARAGPDQQGKLVVHNPWLSAARFEIFMDPVSPTPMLIVVGGSPVGVALVAWRTSSAYHAVRRPQIDGDVVPMRRPSSSPATVATKEPALIAALEADVPYVGLVASAKRGQAVIGSLDLCSSHTSRIHSPAGLDIGARTPDEVALSIMSEIVSLPPETVRPVGHRDSHDHRDGDRSGLWHVRRDGRRIAAPRPRRHPPLVLRQRLPASVRLRSRGLPVVAVAVTTTSTSCSPTSTLSAARLTDVGYLADSGSPPPCSAPPGCRSRSCSRARPASARPRRRRPWRRRSTHPLIRLQCYEGIDAGEALYEWNYTRQLLAIRLAEARREHLADADMFTPGLPARSTAPGRAPTSRATTRGAAGRRDRPRRRRVRGVPPRGARRVGGHDPRARHARSPCTRRSRSSPPTAPATCTTR